MNNKRKINYAINCCKEVLKSFEVQGMEGVMFNALFYRNGKRLNPIENASTQYFSDLMKNYNKTENPDKVKVEFRNEDNNALLWSKEYNLSEQSVEPIHTNASFQGLGEVEINEIVRKHLGKGILCYRVCCFIFVSTASLCHLNMSQTSV